MYDVCKNFVIHNILKKSGLHTISKNSKYAKNSEYILYPKMQNAQSVQKSFFFIFFRKVPRKHIFRRQYLLF